MGKTYTQKMQQREERLSKLPRSERLAKQAFIKKKEGRVLDAAEKHALKMTSEYGEIMKFWEQLRTLPNTDERRHVKDKEEAANGGAEEKQEENVPTKYKVVKNLYNIIFPKFDEMARTPKISRVLQSCIKYGSTDQLLKLSAQLAKNFVSFANDAYAHHIICAMFRHVPHNLYATLLKQVLSNMGSLVTHKFGMLVINAAYTNKLCSANDRNLVILGVFKDNVAVMKQWPGYPVLEEILKHDGEHKKRLIQSLFNLTDKLVSQKEAYELPFVQRLVSAFLKQGTKSDVQELCVTVKPHLAKLMTSKEGSELVSLAFSLLQPKSRKDVLRQISDEFALFAGDKYAAPVIARMFDLVYDGQILFKYFTSKMVNEMPAIMASPYAHCILLHLLTPDDDRKRHALFPQWFEHNLYSDTNKNWNLHTWLDDLYNEETVEICGKDARKTHMVALPTIVGAYLEYAASARDKPNFPKHFVARVAKEVVNLLETEPEYAEALNLDDAAIALVTELMPNKEKKKREDGDDDDEKEDVAPKKSAKKSGDAVAKKPMKKDAASPATSAKKKSAGGASPVLSAKKGSMSPKQAALATPQSGLKKKPSTASSSSIKKLHKDESFDEDPEAPVERSARSGPRDSAPVVAATKKGGKAAPAATGKKGVRPALAAASKGKKVKKFSEDDE